jgi:cytochrome c biogenesis protein CcdA
MESKAGSILALIGGILQFLSAAILLIIGIMAAVSAGNQLGGVGVAFGAVYIVLGVVWIVIGILAIKAYSWMKVPETTKKGGITALICGIIGGNILTLIGGILGIVDAGKNQQNTPNTQQKQNTQSTQQTQ